MNYLSKITEKAKCTEGMSPATVYKCKVEDKTVYLKKIDEKGDVGANLLIRDDELYFIDWARAGIADKWLDIAGYIKDMQEFFPDSIMKKYSSRC